MLVSGIVGDDDLCNLPEAFQINYNEDRSDRFACFTRCSWDNFSCETFGVDQDGLPVLLGGALLVKFRKIHVSEEVHIDGSSFLIHKSALSPAIWNGWPRQTLSVLESVTPQFKVMRISRRHEPYETLTKPVSYIGARIRTCKAHHRGQQSNTARRSGYYSVVKINC